MKEKIFGRPEIKFDNRSLKVRFDHPATLIFGGLKLSLVNVDSATTFFTVKRRPKKLEGPIIFLPDEVLIGVAQGLRGYLDDEQLAPSERYLVQLGVNRLEKLVESRTGKLERREI